MASLMQRHAVSDYPRPHNKTPLLLFSDCAERLDWLHALLAYEAVEIHVASSLEELQGECASEHALAVIDVNPAQLPQVLDIIRASRGHSEIPLLVETSRCNQPLLAGLLPKYRAMPCGLRELVALAQPGDEQTPQSIRPML
ncbi:MAG: hypothetical protein HYR56_09630 [Acidobacteria bacterium]|nr:hypothetical protein [Acidobacteriota bacterium]MBI3424969.1 hypothetical protein [Acidobacteriota bacterium]